MKPRLVIASLGLAVLLAGVAGVAYRLGTEHGPRVAAATPSAAASTAAAPPERLPQGLAEGEAATRRHIATGLKAGEMDPATGRRILYYHDPMVPASKFDKPAKSPFMDMMLVPVYGGADGDENNVSVSPRIQQNLGVRTALVTQGALSPQVSAVGSIAFNERDQAVVQARATGFVERVLVRATLDPVKKGQALVDLYVPEWIAAQEEFLSVRRMQGADLASLVDGARQRMRQVGMDDAQILAVESIGRTQPRVSIRSPLDGVVVESLVRDGMTVTAGTTLFRINGLGTVWANAEVPESQAAQLRPGARVRARSPAVPGVDFVGTVQALLPEVNAGTRTLKARMQLANPGARLVPGMFVTMDFMDTRPGKVLLVPSDAVIQTGKRTVVLLAEADGHFRPVDVQSGLESDGQTEIRSGLAAGQRVVVSSQFLIDSEASLRGVEARLNDVPAATSGPASGTTR
ncbi:MAG: efflux RND transporter periplasmic adaptor subunit [Caldimonas sp.]